MKLKNVLISSVAILFALMLASTSFAQRLVLFETFTNEANPCGSGGIAGRADFNSSVNQVVSSESSKIIHLNHHYGNESDWIEYPNSGSVATRLGAGNTLFYGAVDRSSQIYSSSNTSNSNRLSLSPSDWSSAIDYEAGIAPEATLSLVSAQLDTVTLNSASENVLLTNVSVTLNQDFPNGLVIGYAILQDNVKDTNYCVGGFITLNDVVRYCTIVDTGTFTVTGSSGSTVNVYSNQEISGRTAQLQVPWNYSNLRLVAWLEEAPKGNFDIVNAATLVPSPGMNFLPLPPTSITLDNSAVDGQTFNPGGNNNGIPFTATNVSAVDEYYSLDNGKTWVVIADSVHIKTWPNAYVYATFPNIETTQGKIKIVAVNNPSDSAVELGNFIIKIQPNLVFLHPQAGDTVDAGGSYQIQWADTGVSTVKLEYQYANSNTWHLIADKVPGTSYTWNPVPDTNNFAIIRITTDNGEAGLQVGSIFYIKKNLFNGVASNPTLQSGLTITSIAPNPAQNGEQLVIRYADQNAPSIKLEMLDLLGHTVVTQTLQSSQSGEADIQTQTLYAGTYIVRLNDGTNTVTKRVEIIR